MSSLRLEDLLDGYETEAEHIAKLELGEMVSYFIDKDIIQSLFAEEIRLPYERETKPAVEVVNDRYITWVEDMKLGNQTREVTRFKDIQGGING